MQVYRGLPILTAQAERQRSSRRSGSSITRHPSSSTRRSHIGPSTRPWSTAAHRSSWEGAGSTSALPFPTWRRRRRATARAGSASTTAWGPSAPMLCSPSRIRRQQHASIPNDRRRVVRALELTELGESLQPGRDALWSSETRHPTVLFGLDVPREELERRIVALAPGRCSTPESKTRSNARWPAGSRTRRAMRSVSTRSPGCPGTRRSAAVILRTRRYAAYQRKWMRKMPDLIRVEAARPADEVADEILQVARARERLPAH